MTSAETEKCQVCQNLHPARELTLMRAPCGCDITMCPSCQRQPMTIEWLKYYTGACRTHRSDTALALSA